MRNLNCALCLGYSLRPKAECCSLVKEHSFFFAHCDQPKLFQLICFYAMLSMAWKNSEPWFVLLNSGMVTRAQLANQTQGVKIPYAPSHFMKCKPKFEAFVMTNCWAFKG